MRILWLATAVALLGGCGGGSNGNRADLGPNRAPQISTATTLEVAANSATSAEVTLADDRTAVDALTVAIEVSDPVLLPAGAVVLSTAATVRTLSVQPAIDSVGRAEIVLTVADETGLESSARLTLDVLALEREAGAFSRSLADRDEFEAPELINAVAFLGTAEDQDFSDLLEP
ncbi:MAG: hypothetical protein AAGG11_01505 [Pseudomonadota bacterium]